MAPTSKILVVEDETNVAETLVDRLKHEGFDVTWAADGARATEAIGGTRFDLALLDVGLPDTTGFALARLIREKDPSTALVFLTAFSNPEDRVKGLELGAEDYVTKPFNFKELLLRIQNSLKRASFVSLPPGAAEGKIKVGRAAIDFSRFVAEIDGKAHPLTHKECAVLKLLYERSGKVVSRDEILDHAWSENEYPTPRTVDNFILRLRKLVERDAEKPEVIRSVRGVGYQLNSGKEGENG
jgi:two-component system, OmpR family, alkaline phosphatase synthesis response regulator PhoP